MQADDVQREMARLDYEAAKAEVAARLQFQAAFAEQALKTLMLVNGGAIVALFTFIGKTGDLQMDAERLWWAFGCFAAGLSLNLAAYFGAFFSQAQFYDITQREAWNQQHLYLTGEKGEFNLTEPYKRGRNAWLGGIILAGLSWACFVIGSGFALAGVLPA